MGAEFSALEASGFIYESGVTINAIDDVFAHWDHKVNSDTYVASGVTRQNFWTDSKNNYTLRKPSASVNGFRVLSDGIGQLSGDANLIIAASGDDPDDFNFLSDQSACSVHLVFRKKSFGADNAEIQFGKFQLPSTDRALYGFLRSGLARARYTANYQASIVPDDQLCLLSYIHYGGSGANNFRITCGASTGLYSQVGSNTGGSLFIRIVNGNLVDFSLAKIVVAKHPGKTTTQIDNWRSLTFLPVLKSESEYSALT